MFFKKLFKTIVTTIILLDITVNSQKINFRKKSKNVLFIGNSFTSSNRMPFLFKKIAYKNNKKINVYQSTKNSYTFNAHSNDKDTLKLIKKRNYKAIFLQEQSMFLSQPYYFYKIHSLPYLEKLDKLIEGKTDNLYLFLTWGYFNGNGFADTYDNMQDRLFNGYNEALKTIKYNNSKISQVGSYWKIAYPELKLKLYKEDGQHPSLLGSYLSACVHFRSVFNKKVNYKYRPKGINKKDHKMLTDICNLDLFNISNIT